MVMEIEMASMVGNNAIIGRIYPRYLGIGRHSYLLHLLYPVDLTCNSITLIVLRECLLALPSYAGRCGSQGP